MVIAGSDAPSIHRFAVQCQRTAGRNPHEKPNTTPATSAAGKPYGSWSGMIRTHAPFGIPSAPMETLDFKVIARAALPHASELCQRWLPGGKLRGREWVCGDLRGGPGESCSVNTITGRWADFASGQKGGDLISLAAAVHGLSQVDACRKLATMLGGHR